jgi:hypothetical protein
VRTGFASGRRRGPSPDVPGRRAGRRVTPVTRAPRRGAVRRDPRSARRARDASMRAAQVDDLTTWMTGGAGARRAPRSCVQARSSRRTCSRENLPSRKLGGNPPLPYRDGLRCPQPCTSRD